MAGRAEIAHGSDRASRIMKYDGLPGEGKPIIDDFSKKQASVIPVLGSFVSTMGGAGVELSPLGNSFTTAADEYKKPKFTAKITLFDSHGDDNF